MEAKISEADFIRLFQEIGPYRLAKQSGVSEKNVMSRRRRIEQRTGISLAGPNTKKNKLIVSSHARLQTTIKNGIVLIGSDPHYWPGITSTAHRAFIWAIKEFQPSIVVMNGDVLDGSTISRWPPIGWEKRPSLVDEIETCQERLHEIELACKRSTELYWPLGNHDARFETRIATVAPEYAKINGVHLRDHFGDRWQPCWSVFVNDDVAIKHRFKGGIHAAHNNTIWAGRSIFTGHLHSLKVIPFDDWNGTRWGVDTGTLADPNGPQFVNYSEDNPKNHRSGFIVATFDGGKLLWPEVVRVVDDRHVDFRGKLWAV